MVSFVGSPYTLKVPVNEIHAMKISHPLRTVDELHGPSASICHHEKLFRTNLMR